MSDYGIYEHVVTKESGRGRGRLRVLLIALICLCVLGLLWLGLLWQMFFLFLAISIAAAFFAFMLLRRYSSVEFEYSIADGTMTFSEIYGKRTRKTAVSFDIKRCYRIAPHDDPKIADYGATDCYFALSSPEAEMVYCAVYENERGKRSAVYFEATEQALKILRKNNPAATVLWRAV